tara:strand:- start:6133 stop:6351 length:219 start_codon:yes stop_codon:yes gene_type:complete
MENKSIKSDVDFILETYEKEVRFLIDEANTLYDKIEKSKSILNCNYYLNKINNINKKQKAIEQCYNDCIIDL